MIEYPYTLSYTLPNGYKVKVKVNSSAESEAAMDHMFSHCGPAVNYSVD
jgi:hypothetical protein